MKQTYYQRLKQAKFAKAMIAIVVVALVSVGGALYAVVSHANTPTVAVDPEAGTVTAPVTKITDVTANNGGAIKFGPVPPVVVPTPPVITPPPISGRTLLNQNFDGVASTNQMTLGAFSTAMGNNSTSSYALPNTSIVAASGRGNVIRQTLQANEYGGSKGVVVFPTLSSTVDEASIQYDIRFDSNFDWSLGGKLPGLGGADGATTASTASGCNSGNEDAWSGRGMWLTPGAGYSSEHPKSPNEWIGYMYNYYKKETCGDNIRTTKSFVAGSWHTIKQYYKMNTPGVADGVHKMWFDGTLVVDNHAFRYRTKSDLHINYLFWAIFRGGNTAAWASSHANTIDIDNLLVTTP